LKTIGATKTVSKSSSHVEAESNISTVALGVVAGEEKELSVWRYHRDNLILGDINTGT
jgi:hypothetical protein